MFCKKIKEVTVHHVVPRFQLNERNPRLTFFLFSTQEAETYRWKSNVSQLLKELNVEITAPSRSEIYYETSFVSLISRYVGKHCVKVRRKRLLNTSNRPCSLFFFLGGEWKTDFLGEGFRRKEHWNPACWGRMQHSERDFPTNRLVNGSHLALSD